MPGFLVAFAFAPALLGRVVRRVPPHARPTGITRIGGQRAPGSVVAVHSKRRISPGSDDALSRALRSKGEEGRELEKAAEKARTKDSMKAVSRLTHTRIG